MIDETVSKESGGEGDGVTVTGQLNVSVIYIYKYVICCGLRLYQFELPLT